MFITAVCFLFLIKLHWCSKIIWRVLVLNSFKDDNDLRTSVSLFHMFAEVYRKEWRSSWCYQQLRFVLLWSLFFKTWEHQPLVFFMDLELAVLRPWIEQAPDWVTGKTPAIPAPLSMAKCSVFVHVFNWMVCVHLLLFLYGLLLWLLVFFWS